MSVKSVSFDENLSIRHFEKDENEKTIESLDLSIDMRAMEKDESLVDSTPDKFHEIITEAKKAIESDFQKIFSIAIESADEDEIKQIKKRLEVEKERQYSSYGQDVLNFTKDLECRDDEVAHDSKLLENLIEEFQDVLDEKIKKLGRRISLLGGRLEYLEIKKIFDEISSEKQIKKILKGLEGKKASLEGGWLTRFLFGLPESDVRNINRVDKGIVHLNEKLLGLKNDRDRYDHSINSNDSKKLIEAIAYFEDTLKEQSKLEQDLKEQIKVYIEGLRAKLEELQEAINETLNGKEEDLS